MKEKQKIESFNKIKLQLGTICYLYLFLLTMPFFIITLSGVSINLNQKSVFIISFIYSILCFILSGFTYKKFSKLDDETLKKKINIFKKGLLVVFIYFFTSIFQAVPLLLIANNINTLPLIIKTTYLTIYQILQVGIIIYILKDELKRCINDIKNNHKTYFSGCVKYYLLAIIIMTLSNLIISFINSGNIAGNEEAVRETFNKAPFYMYFSAVIIAPLLEELTFRQGIRNIISNKKVFIIVSGLVFGGLHVIGSINSPIDLLYLIPYSVPGFAFAYMLTKTDNIIVPVGFHFLHNGITMSLQVLLMILGA